MFKNANILFENKKIAWAKNRKLEQEINEILDIFFNKEFKNIPKGLFFAASYKSKDRSLIIETKNKILANEVALRLGNLIDLFKDKRIILSKILVR